jgi:hypothetical protein
VVGWLPVGPLVFGSLITDRRTADGLPVGPPKVDRLPAGPPVVGRLKAGPPAAGRLADGSRIAAPPPGLPPAGCEAGLAADSDLAGAGGLGFLLSSALARVPTPRSPATISTTELLLMTLRKIDMLIEFSTLFICKAARHLAGTDNDSTSLTFLFLKVTLISFQLAAMKFAFPEDYLSTIEQCAVESLLHVDQKYRHQHHDREF